MFPFSELFLASTPQKKIWNVSESTGGRREGKGTLHFPFSTFKSEEKKKEKKGGKKSFFNQPKAATHSEKKQKHQNHHRLNSKICLCTNTQPAKLGGKLAETPLNLNQVQLLIREQLLLAWQGGNGRVNTQDLLALLELPGNSSGSGQEQDNRLLHWRKEIRALTRG